MSAGISLGFARPWFVNICEGDRRRKEIYGMMGVEVMW